MVKVFEEGGEVIRIIFDSVFVFLKRFVFEFGISFMVEGIVDDGIYLVVKVVNGKLVEFCLK